jgi:hypothetical protein
MPTRPLATALLFGIAATLTGAEVAWNGVADGAWSGPGSWKGGAIPGASDTAVLGDVASGTRTITVDRATTVACVTMSQTSGGTNRLVLAGDLTIAARSHAPSLALARSAGALAIDLNGRKLLIEGEHVGTIQLPGTLEMGKGSKLELSFSAGQGGAEVVNTGTVIQDGGTMLFHWRPTGTNNASRRFVNGAGATWTLSDGSAIEWLSDNGFRAGWGLMYGCRNEGTMTIGGGSTVAVASLDNLGTLTVDGGRFGGGITDTKLRNAGTVRVVGTAFIGQESCQPGGSIARFENGIEGAAGAVLTVGDAGKAGELTLSNPAATLKNDAGNRVTVAAGSAIALATVCDTDPHPNYGRPTTVLNYGDWRHEGGLRLKPNGAPVGTIGVLNKGTFTVVGAGAFIERLPAPRSGWYNETNQSAFANHADAVLTGDATLTYRNATGNAGAAALQVINSGTIRPGTEAAGVLTLVDADVRFSESGSGTLAIRVFGAKADACDRLVLAGEHGGTFALGEEGSTLSVTLAKGFAPKAAASWRIVTAKTIAGAFQTLDLPKGFAVASDAKGLLLSFKP